VQTTNFAPGPTPVPNRVLQRMSEPIYTHRSAEFTDLLFQVTTGLQQVFQTKNDLLVLTASGTGAMEAAVVNLLAPGDRVLAITSGKFGNRWIELCSTFGQDARTLEVEWGQAVDAGEVDRVLRTEGPFKALLATQSETSTGVLHDINALGKTARSHGCYFVVDAISGLGANELRTDDWLIDMALSGSQKGLMTPPGLAFITVSERAWDAIGNNPQPSYYLNLRRALDNLKKGFTPYTPAVSLIMGLAESLAMMEEIGLDAIYGIHERNALVTRAAVKALGLDLFDASPSNVRTSVVVPEGIDGSVLLKSIKSMSGVTIANGMDHYKGKVFRIAHLGYDIEPSDMLVAISALERGLSELGHEFEFGAGLAAAQRVILETS